MSTSLDVATARAQIVHQELLDNPDCRHVDAIPGLPRLRRWDTDCLDEAIDVLIVRGTITESPTGLLEVHPW